jgi:hypothetical protein
MSEKTKNAIAFAMGVMFGLAIIAPFIMAVFRAVTH